MTLAPTTNPRPEAFSLSPIAPNPMYNPYSLAGKTILITGASSGIGRATAVECSRMGATCVITGRNEVRLLETLSMMEGAGHLSIAADLSTPEGVNLLVSRLSPLAQSPSRPLASLDGLVLNAGTAVMSPVGFLKPEDIASVFATNTYAPMLLVKALNRKLKTGGSIVFTSSMDIDRPEGANSIYAASKGALTSFMRACAKELAPRQIRANAVVPGMIETPFIGGDMISEEELAIDRNRYPLKRFGKPEEVAWLIIYLLSDASAFMTGSAVKMNGGIELI